ncbi:MAG: OmpA family protein [Pseudomonadales bacterium]
MNDTPWTSTRQRLTAAVVVLAVCVLLPQPADAQSFRDRVLKSAKEQVDRRIETRADEVVGKGLDRTEEAIRCAASDADCIRQAQSDGRNVIYTDGSGNVVATPADGGSDVGAQSAGGEGRIGEGAWANYDFVPGERVLFADDFSGDRVGNFPRRLEFVNGTMEIVDFHGGRYLRATSDGRFEIRLPEALPERFTIEFDAHLPHWWHQLFLAMGEPDGGYKNVRAAYQRLDRYPFSYVQLSQQFQSGLRGDGGGEALTTHAALHQQIVPVRIMADGRYVKVFLNERRIANVPNANLRRSSTLAVFITGEVAEHRPVFIGNFRIAAGGPSLYDALQTDGRVSTQGILFDPGSDRIRPESTPTLKEIGEMLGGHGGLRLRIEGHTDSTGSVDANQQLSERRAAAVKQQLIGDFGVDASRLEAVGKGQSEPAASNDTPEGRQNNRRVVLVMI